MSQITLISSDSKQYNADKASMIGESGLIRELLEDDNETTSLNIPYVTSPYLELIIEFCEYNYAHQDELVINKVTKPQICSDNLGENIILKVETIVCKTKNIEENAPKWYADFIKKVDNVVPFESLLKFRDACDYMQVIKAYDLAQLFYDTKIKDCTPDEVRAAIGKKPFELFKINEMSEKSRKLLSVEYVKPESDIKLGKVLE